MKARLTTRDIQTLLSSEPESFPRYATQIINLANQNAQGTRPRVVGQQTELIQQFPGKTLDEWQVWYLEQYPDAIGEATKRIYATVQQLQSTIQQIDESMVERWVRDLVLVKTFIGLRFQQAILQKVADVSGTSHKPASVEEEARGIDGYVGALPVSIKPDSYKTMAQLPESIAVGIIFYTKTKDGLTLEWNF